MSTADLEGALAVLVSLGAFLVGVLVWKSTRQGTQDANKIATEANRVADEQAGLDLIMATNETLRVNLKGAQDETDTLRADIGSAREEIRLLRSEIDAALVNVAILSDHIREHVPREIPFPRLRKVDLHGG